MPIQVSTSPDNLPQAINNNVLPADEVLSSSIPDVAGLLEKSIKVRDSEFARSALQAENRDEMNEELEQVLASLVVLRLQALKVSNYPGERDESEIFLAAQAGDEEAQHQIDEALTLAEKHDSLVREQRLANWKDGALSTGLNSDEVAELITPEAIGYEHFSVVHATNYEPIRPLTNRDNLRISNTFMTSGLPRSTVHVALNHMVESHYTSSDWGDYRVVVVAPMQEVVELNGEPASMIAHDTWFETKPGKGLVLPEDTIIVKPGASQPVQKLERSQEIRYMNQGISRENVDELFGMSDDYEVGLLARELGIKVDVTSSRRDAKHHAYGELRDTRLAMYTTSLSIDSRASVKNGLITLLDSDTTQAEKLFARLAKRVAVRWALQKQGHTVLEPLTIMEGNFMSDEISDDLNKFALSRGMTGHHSESTAGEVEKAVYSAMREDGTIAADKLAYARGEVMNNIDKLSIATLTMYYRMGLV